MKYLVYGYDRTFNGTVEGINFTNGEATIETDDVKKIQKLEQLGYRAEIIRDPNEQYEPAAAAPEPEPPKAKKDASAKGK